MLREMESLGVNLTQTAIDKPKELIVTMAFSPAKQFCLQAH